MALHAFSGAPAMDMSAANIENILVGFQNFLDRHTGDVGDTGGGIFCINSASILLNNMHYEVALSGYMPNGTAVTEAQALAVTGYLYLHRRYKDLHLENNYLAQAKRFCEAYFKYYYQQTVIPDTPQIWRSHWAINGKEPFRTLGPVNFADPSGSGAWDVPVVFENGVGYAPAGSPYYCEQLAKVYNVYDGLMNWDNVTAKPVGGTGPVAVDFFVDDRGMRMNLAGDDIDEEPQTEFPTRYIRLKDTTFNGTLNIAFSCRSGHMIGRNKPFEGWPMWQHVERAYFGNASDAEAWFCEALWMMAQDTGEQRYLRAYNCCFYTLWNEMANFPLQNTLFIWDKEHVTTTPFTEGISYWWDYVVNADTTCVRNPNDGYIRIEKTEELFIEDMSQVALEQQALINKVDESSYISMEFGITSDLKKQPFSKTSMYCTIVQSLVGNEKGIVYRHPVFSNNNVKPETNSYYLKNMVEFTNAAGEEFVMLNGQKNLIPYNQAEASGVIEYGILNEQHRIDYCGTVRIPNTSSGITVGFWDSTPSARPLSNLTYKYTTAGPIVIYATDANGWHWEYILPGAGTNSWTTAQITWSKMRLRTSQDNTGPRPSAPVPNNAMTQFQLRLPEGADDIVGAMTIYCYGAVPKFFTGTGLMNHWKLMIFDHYDFIANLGDVKVLGAQQFKETYTPGVIAFSTNYSQKKGKPSFYRGAPYTGYIYPVMWLVGGKMEAVNNCIDFFYDAQVDYHKKKGIWGPQAPVYIWARADDLEKGAIPETFSYVDLDGKLPWNGYYSRAVFSACRLYEEMVNMGLPVPEKLRLVCERWMDYLADFMENNDDLTPTVFPVEGLPYNNGYNVNPELSDPTHNSDMTSHFLGSAIMLKLSGNTNTSIDRVIQGCVREFERTYVIVNGDHKHMSGGYSSWYGGDYFYGFWAGEIMRALALLMKYRDTQHRHPPSAVEDSLWRIGLEDGSTLETEDDGLFLYNNPVYFNSQSIGFLLENNGYIMLEDGESLLCLEAE